MVGAIIGGIICIIAGLYLSQIRSVGGNRIMEGIGNGIGWYCIGKGIYLISNAVQLSRLGKIKDTLIEMALHQGAIKDQRKWVKNKDGEWIRNPMENK